MLNTKCFLSLFILTGFIFVTNAGECLDDDTTFINDLLNFNDGYAYMCLTWWNTSTNRWAGPRFEESIKSLRNYHLKHKIEEICKKYIDSSYSKNPIDSQMLKNFANMAARYGFKKIDGYDIFPILMQFSKELSYENIAALGDERAIPVIKDKYVMFRKNKLSKANREILITYLNCLYHLPQPFAKEAAQELLTTETDSILISRLKLITGKK